jgi:hypothetical protein
MRLSNLRDSLMVFDICESTSMLYTPEKMPVLAKAKDKAPSAAFFGLALLAMAGWMYLLSAIFLKFVLWCIS